jgi:hypothetical protein
MVSTLTRIKKEPGIKSVSPESPKAWQATNSHSVHTITLVASGEGDYLTWEDDPVLAELWDNAEDAAAFDNL